MKPIDKHDPFDRPHLREDYVDHNFNPINGEQRKRPSRAPQYRHRKYMEARPELKPKTPTKGRAKILTN